MKGDGLQKLLAQYPSHSFIIDREEANDLFKNVREPKPLEAELIKAIGEFARSPREPVLFNLLSNMVQEGQNESEDGKAKDGSRDKERRIQTNGRSSNVSESTGAGS